MFALRDLARELGTSEYEIEVEYPDEVDYIGTVAFITDRAADALRREWESYPLAECDCNDAHCQV